MAKVKIPKRVAGMKIPKKVRRKANKAVRMAESPVVREFAVRVPAIDDLFSRAREVGINPGYRLGRDYPEYADGLLVAITERRTKAQSDQFAALLQKVAA